MNNIVIKALRFAAHKHRDDRRKDIEASPYINHPIDVLHILSAEAGIADNELLAAAALHDTLEDTDTSIEELEKLFGKKIAGIVVEVTDDQSLSRSERYTLQAEKALNYSPEAKLIRLADKISNMRDATNSPPPSWSTERLAGHFQQSLRIVNLLRGTHAKLEELFEKEYVLAEKMMQDSA